MEFLVRIDIALPADLPEAEQRRLLDVETRRARELRAEGTLRRIWRVPGRRANWSLYEAPDATRLHDALSSLPLWPWMSVEVHPLAAHPVETDG